MKTPVDLAYALTLPPEKAVAYYRRKGRRVSFDWHSMWKEAHATAFTVANCAKLDVLRDLQLAIRTMLKEEKREVVHPNAGAGHARQGLVGTA